MSILLETGNWKLETGGKSSARKSVSLPGRERKDRSRSLDSLGHAQVYSIRFDLSGEERRERRGAAQDEDSFAESSRKIRGSVRRRERERERAGRIDETSSQVHILGSKPTAVDSPCARALSFSLSLLCLAANSLGSFLPIVFFFSSFLLVAALPG